jgi:hypothetical protein
MARKGKRSKRKSERFSLYPMKFEDAVKQALKADPEEVRVKMAGLKGKKKADPS